MRFMFRELTVIIRGAGEMATGAACRLSRCGFDRILMTEIPDPLAVRRTVSFSEAVHDGSKTVEGITAARISDADKASEAWSQGLIPLLVDPEESAISRLKPDIVIDAILAKINTGTHLSDAPLVIGYGPGFFAGEDVHFVIETNRGHNLGRVIAEGPSEPNTGVPGSLGGQSDLRVLRAPSTGVFTSDRAIGELVKVGDVIGATDGETVTAKLDGVLRGLIRPGTPVTKRLKIGDVDPRGDPSYCSTISDKARAVAGGALEAILMWAVSKTS
jgi:xanthine dehydrogenase accessory factor